MQTIAITYDPAKRRITASSECAGTTIDDLSTTLQVSGIPTGWGGRIEFGVTVKDTTGANVRPYLSLDGTGSCVLTRPILNACRRDNRLPLQLVIDHTVDDQTETIGSNILIFSVDPSIDALAEFSESYDDPWHKILIDAESEPGAIQFTRMDGTHKMVELDLSGAEIPASAITGVISPEHLPAGVVEKLVKVQDDTERFALTTDEVQNWDTVLVLDTNLMYMVVDDTKLDSEDGYEPYKAYLYWGGIDGDLEDQADLKGALDAKADVSEGIEQWDVQVTYSAGAITNVGGTLYISLVSDNLGHDPTEDDPIDPHYWRTLTVTHVVSEGSFMAVTIGNGVDSQFVITHSFDSYDVAVDIFENNGTRADFSTLVERLNVNQVRLTFTEPPASNSVRVLLSIPGGPVTSVQGRVGNVVVTADDLGLGNVVTKEEGIAQWDPTIEYGDAAITNVNGTLYISLQPDNLNHDPLNSTGWWDEIHTGSGTRDVTNTKKFVIGDGATTQFTLQHSLNTYDVNVLIYSNDATKHTTGATVERLNNNDVRVSFVVAPATDEITVVVQKLGAAIAYLEDGQYVLLTASDLGVEEGAQVNVIETVKVNGTALTPDANKAVDVTVPTALSALAEDSTHRVTTDAEKSAWDGKASSFETTITGNGSQTEFNIAHSFGHCPQVSLYESDGTEISTLTKVFVNSIKLIFITAPENGVTYKVVMTR